MSLLALAARHGRWCLVAGLLAGLGLPGLALTLRPWLPELVAGLLFVAALRIGPGATLGGLRELGHTLRTVAIYQLVAPLVALALVTALGVAGTAPALALVLVLAAPSVTGSPNFTILMGRDPSVTMRILLIGTALCPLTALPVLTLAPFVATPADAVTGTARLIAVIFGTVGLAFALHGIFLRDLGDKGRSALDGISALLLAVVVVGLMSAAGPAMLQTPIQFILWLALAFAVNFGGQILAHRLMPVADETRDRTGTSIVAGNRNIALFLVALPPELMERVLLFIGCYQIPMYLTPILLGRVLAPRIPAEDHT
ncbi:hypothetical protein AB9K41_21905 [Cribrihabitans sp. XS_ASV171]